MTDSLKKILPLIFVLFSFIGFVQAQTPDETRKWIGFGQNFGFYDEDGMPGNQEVKGTTYEYMAGHYTFDDSTTKGQAYLYNDFSSKFEDTSGNNHDMYTRTFHTYYSYGLGKTYEVSNKFQVGATVDVLGGLGIVVFKKDYTPANGNEIKFDERFGFDILTGFQWAIYFDINNYWVIGTKASYFQNRLNLEFGDSVGQLDHNYSTMLFIGIKKGFTDCVPTAYVQC